MPGADAFIAAIRDADAVLFATPEYNGSIPGVLKNAIDWASRPTPATSPLARKPVAVIGASTGSFGAVWAQAELRKALGLAGARVLDHELAVPTAHEAFTDDGRLLRGGPKRRLREILADVVREVRGGVRVRGGKSRLRRRTESDPFAGRCRTPAEPCFARSRCSHWVGPVRRGVSI